MPKNSRYEIKFVCYDIYYYEIFNWIKLHKSLWEKEYDSRLVNNVYFDTHDFDSYKDNIYGESQRTKVRYRWYGNFKNSSLGSLELKHKRNIFGWKERFSIKDFYFPSDLNWNQIVSLFYKNISIEGQIWLNKYSVPTIINQYLRRYFITRDKKIRLTLDTNYSIYDQRYSNKPNLEKVFLKQPILILEIKFDRGIVKNAMHMFKDIPIRASKNSKYIYSIRSVVGV